MKTKVRIQRTRGTGLCANFLHMSIQILVPRYKGARYLEPMGEITFQANANETEFFAGGNVSDHWYGMNFVINTNKPEYIFAMAKLAKFIKQNRDGHYSQPVEILQIIGAEEHGIFESEFVSVLDKGKNLYRVIVDGQFYSTIIAPNETIAQRIMNKQKLQGDLLLHKKIEF